MKPFKLPARLWQTLLLILTAAAFSPLSVFAAEAGEYEEAVGRNRGGI